MSQRELLNPLEANLNENKGSAMKRKSFHMHYQPFITQNRERKRGIEGIKSNLSENEVNSMDINFVIELPLHYRLILEKTRL